MVWPFVEYICASVYIPFFCCEFFSITTFHYGFASSFYNKNVTPAGVTVPGELWSDYAQLIIVDFEEVTITTEDWSMKFLGEILAEHSKKKIQCTTLKCKLSKSMETNKPPHARSWEANQARKTERQNGKYDSDQYQDFCGWQYSALMTVFGSSVSFYLCNFPVLVLAYTLCVCISVCVCTYKKLLHWA